MPLAPDKAGTVIPANIHDLAVTTEHENTLSQLLGGTLSVIPAEAGIQKSWIPAFAGMTSSGGLAEIPTWGIFR
jgi:hypothetical protein